MNWTIVCGVVLAALPLTAMAADKGEISLNARRPGMYGNCVLRWVTCASTRERDGNSKLTTAPTDTPRVYATSTPATQPMVSGSRSSGTTSVDRRFCV